MRRGGGGANGHRSDPWRRVTRLTGSLLLVGAILPGPAGPRAEVDAGRGGLILSLPGQRWVLRLAAPGFVVRTDDIQAGGHVRYLYAVNPATDVVLSVRLERDAGARSSVECRNRARSHIQARSPFRMEAVRTGERGRLAVLEYRVPEVRGARVDQQHIHAYLGQDDVCAEVHLSKVAFRPADDRLFAAILDSVGVDEQGATASPGPSAGAVRRPYALPGGVVLALPVPADWVASRGPTSAEAPFSVTFSPPARRAFQVLVSAVAPPGGGTRVDVRALVERSGQAFLPSAVESHLVLEELRGPHASGYFYRLTDKAPKLGEYTHLIQGAVGVAQLVLTFTILSDRPDAPEAVAALEMMRLVETSPGA